MKYIANVTYVELMSFGIKAGLFNYNRWFFLHIQIFKNLHFGLSCFYYNCLYVNHDMSLGSSSDAEDRGATASWDVGGEEAAKGSRAATSQGALGLSHRGDGLACSGLCSRAQVEESCCKKGTLIVVVLFVFK